MKAVLSCAYLQNYISQQSVSYALSCALSMIEKYIIFMMFDFGFKFSLFQFQFSSFLLSTCELYSDLNYDLHFLLLSACWIGVEEIGNLFIISRRSCKNAARRSVGLNVIYDDDWVFVSIWPIIIHAEYWIELLTTANLSPLQPLWDLCRTNFIQFRVLFHFN